MHNAVTNLRDFSKIQTQGINRMPEATLKKWIILCVSACLILAVVLLVVGRKHHFEIDKKEK